jgi:UPF0755 protein
MASLPQHQGGRAPQPAAGPPGANARRRNLIRAAAAFAVVVAAVAFWGYRQVHAPGPLKAQATVIIPKGAGTSEIGQRLAAAGVLDRAWTFTLAAWFLAPDRGLKAGEYAFEPGTSAASAVALIESGRTVMRRLTVAEGLTSAEIVALVNATEGLAGRAPQYVAEGSVLPETYFYTYGDSRAELILRMQRSLEELLEAQWRDRAPGTPLRTKQEALTLASIIEKETGISSERPRISAVFHNRLRIGMRLQSDPTVIYALTRGSGALGRSLMREDLNVDSPYNTYRTAGLPPGPIANAGRASIISAFRPAKTDDLYFVANGDGGHVFARSLNEHNANVAKWRRLMRD